MPIFVLDEAPVFPDPSLANKQGLLAVGGDLSVERLVNAYKNGIFPWYEDDTPILWWSPDPRLVLYPEKFKISHSLKQKLSSNKFETYFDTNFKKVIINCAKVSRDGQNGTWITDEMIEAYIILHEQGIAHSAETYMDGKLVGGLYGLSIGKAFFGESMFHTVSDASKIALAALVDRLLKHQFHFIDAQQNTAHLRSLGAVLVPRKKFMEMLEKAVSFPVDFKIW